LCRLFAKTEKKKEESGVKRQESGVKSQESREKNKDKSGKSGGSLEV